MGRSGGEERDGCLVERDVLVFTVRRDRMTEIAR